MRLQDTAIRRIVTQIHVPGSGRMSQTLTFGEAIEVAAIVLDGRGAEVAIGTIAATQG
jgi:hypothetical protein